MKITYITKVCITMHTNLNFKFKPPLYFFKESSTFKHEILL